jgi:hypothetical protein
LEWGGGLFKESDYYEKKGYYTALYTVPKEMKDSKFFSTKKNYTLNAPLSD